MKIVKEMFDSELSKDYGFDLSLAKKMNLFTEDELWDIKLLQKGLIISM